MRSSNRLLVCLALVGASLAFPAGCSLDGLVFDVPDTAAGGGGASSSSSGVPSSSSGTSSTSSGSGAGGSGGAQGSSSSSSGVVITEDCANGMDDDMDGLADCDDPKCLQIGYSCFDPASVPAGWAGPLILYDGAGAAPACPAGYPTNLLSGITSVSAPASQCSACACSAPIIDCTAGPIDGYLDNTCTVAGGSTFAAPMDGVCTAANVTTSTAFIAAAPMVNLGGCQPVGGSPMNQPFTFNNALGCGEGKGSSCGSGGGVCLAPPPAPFVGRLCIAQAADTPCPDPFTQRHDLADINGVNDTRGCSPCSCGGLSQASCSVVYSLYAKVNCGMKMADVTANGQCTSVNALGAQSLKASIITNGLCSPPSGGMPTGGVSAGTVISVCCLP